MMNAKEQYDHYSAKLEKLMTRAEELHARRVIGAIQNLEAYSMTLAQKILSDLKLKVQAYGDKAFPMTEKQEAVVQRGLKEEFDRLQELTRQYNADNPPAPEPAPVEEKPAEETYQFPFVVQLPDGATVLDEMRVQEIATDYRGGKIRHFEAREQIENRLQAIAFRAAKEEIQDISTWFDMDELNELRDRREAAEDDKLSVTEIAERAGFDRSYVRAEIKAGRLMAKKIGSQHTVKVGDYVEWLNNPKRGSWQQEAKAAESSSPAKAAEPLIARLKTAGSLSAKPQRLTGTNYRDGIYKGGTVVVSIVGENYDVRYKSPEGLEHIARAFPAGKEQELEQFMLALADERRWR